MRAAGGVGEGVEALAAEGVGSLLPPQGKGSWLLSNVLLTSMGVLGMPQMIHKFFAIRDEADDPKAGYDVVSLDDIQDRHELLEIKVKRVVKA